MSRCPGSTPDQFSQSPGAGPSRRYFCKALWEGQCVAKLENHGSKPKEEKMLQERTSQVPCEQGYHNHSGYANTAICCLTTWQPTNAENVASHCNHGKTLGQFDRRACRNYILG